MSTIQDARVGHKDFKTNFLFPIPQITTKLGLGKGCNIGQNFDLCYKLCQALTLLLFEIWEIRNWFQNPCVLLYMFNFGQIFLKSFLISRNLTIFFMGDILTFKRHQISSILYVRSLPFKFQSDLTSRLASPLKLST